MYKSICSTFWDVLKDEQRHENGMRLVVLKGTEI